LEDEKKFTIYIPQTLPYPNMFFAPPTSVSADAGISMSTGAVEGVAVMYSGSGTDTLTFKYTVRVFEVSSDLNYLSAASLTATGTIARTSTTPTTPATLTLPFPTQGSLGSVRLDDTSALIIDGTAPTVTSVDFVADSKTYRRGDSVLITATFSADVVLTGTTPVIVLDVGVITREAVYTSGNRTR